MNVTVEQPSKKLGSHPRFLPVSCSSLPTQGWIWAEGGGGQWRAVRQSPILPLCLPATPPPALSPYSSFSSLSRSPSDSSSFHSLFLNYPSPCSFLSSQAGERCLRHNGRPAPSRLSCHWLPMKKNETSSETRLQQKERERERAQWWWCGW